MSAKASPLTPDQQGDFQIILSHFDYGTPQQNNYWTITFNLVINLSASYYESIQSYTGILYRYGGFYCPWSEQATKTYPHYVLTNLYFRLTGNNVPVIRDPTEVAM